MNVKYLKAKDNLLFVQCAISLLIAKTRTKEDKTKFATLLRFLVNKYIRPSLKLILTMHNLSKNESHTSS